MGIDWRDEESRLSDEEHRGAEGRSGEESIGGEPGNIRARDFIWLTLYGFMCLKTQINNLPIVIALHKTLK